jgi:hypothetical protein
VIYVREDATEERIMEYHRQARECRNMAAKAKSAKSRAVFRQVARAWETLAEEREQFLKSIKAGANTTH